MKGDCYPILTIQERMMNLLAMEMVDDIVLDAPFFINDSFLSDFNIGLVAEGSRSGLKFFGKDPFETPKKLGKFQIIQTADDFTTEKLIQKVFTRETLIRDAIEKRKLKQNAYYEFNKARKIQIVEF